MKKADFVLFLRNRILLLLASLLLFAGFTGKAAADGLPPCSERPLHVDPPWVDGTLWCLERIIHDNSAGELAFTALAFAPDGTLYAARPLAGQVLALKDTDGDGLPDSPQVVADGLTLPNGLAYYADGLYISGGAHIYRLKDGQVEVLVDDLPAAGGFWTGGIAVGLDERIYVGIGASCDFCQQDNHERGAIWSFALDGTDKQVVASGLRQPADLSFRDGRLWTMDSARDGLTDANLDELNLVEVGANFGWPFCIGADNHRDILEGDFDCAKAVAPTFTFPTHSNPLGMTFYDSDTFPDIKGDLLVTLGGSNEQTHIEGYMLVAVHMDDATGLPVDSQIIIPKQTPRPNESNIQSAHYQGSGFWPHRPLDVVVSQEGWIYVSAGGGTIYVIRPL